MHETYLLAFIGIVLCWMMYSAVKFLVVLPYGARLSEEVRLLRALTVIWLFLMLAHSAALFAVYKLEIIDASYADGALLMWALTNQVVALMLADHYRTMSAKMQRALLQYIIAAHGVLLLAWAVSFAVPSVPRTMPGDLTVALGILIILSCGVLWFYIPLGVKPKAVEPKA
jgi:hypothetical protein